MKGLFTVGALDNIDHNQSSTTAVSSFHGTGISLFQFPGRACEKRQPVKIPPVGNRITTLPENYANVPAVAMNTSVIPVPSSTMQPIVCVLPESKCRPLDSIWYWKTLQESQHQ